jgi:hypothetical protein
MCRSLRQIRPWLLSFGLALFVRDWKAYSSDIPPSLYVAAGGVGSNIFARRTVFTMIDFA